MVLGRSLGASWSPFEGGQVGEVILGLRGVTKGLKEAFGNNNEPPGDD